jgi:hypothetical protein
MPIIQPDLSDVTSNDPPVGTWPGLIVAVEDKPSKKGNPMLTVTVAMEIDGQKYELRGYHVYTGKAAYGYENLLRACRYDDVADALKRGERLPFNTDDLLQQPVQVVVEVQPDDNGNPRKQIKQYLPQ